MDINALMLKHGNKIFRVDEQDEWGGSMVIDEYKIHIRNDDLNLAEGLSMNDIRPLIDGVKPV